MILVTGATGNVGREVVNLLLDGSEKVVAVTRHPATAALPDGAHVVGGDPLTSIDFLGKKGEKGGASRRSLLR
jgi:uncharacterized protein YbjT (DUF2867 family)